MVAVENNSSMWEKLYRLSAWALFGLLLGLGGAAGVWLFFLSGFSFIGLGQEALRQPWGLPWERGCFPAPCCGWKAWRLAAGNSGSHKKVRGPFAGTRTFFAVLFMAIPHNSNWYMAKKLPRDAA